MKNLQKLMLLTAAVLPMTAAADVTLPKFFTDSMVVQRNATLKVPGKAKKGATVKVTPSWSGTTIKAKADKKGNFLAEIPTPEAGGPYTITLTDGGKPVTLHDVLVGDVWLCSGQSNMEMPVEGWGNVINHRAEVAAANSPNVRLLQVAKQTSYAPETDTQIYMGGWRPATPQTVGGFSAIGYFFGRDINREVGVPIGVIDCTWGGTPIEAWSSFQTLRDAGEFAPQLAEIEASNFDSSDLVATYADRYAAWQKRAVPEIDYAADMAAAQWAPIPIPNEWEKSVAPTLDGVVWLQCTVDLPADVAGKGGQLHLAAIDDADVTYINGVKVGETDGYNLPRVYNVEPGVLKPGANVIATRVLDTGGGGGIYGSPADLYLQAGDVRVPLAGEWQYSIVSDFAKDPMPVSPLNSNYPTVLYNAMLHPMTVMPVKGVLWYQGCNNVGRDEQYSRLFKAMITDWRKDWGEPELPFYFVQLAAYLAPKQLQPESAWAALRQAQADALELPGVGMVTAIDLGNADDIHPKNKQEVARRLANLALANQYGKHVTANAPAIKKADFKGRHCTVTFDGEIMLNGGGNGFIARGTDGKWALAYGVKTSPVTVEVICDDVDSIEEVRYDWADYPMGNLRGASGLPVPPFKTAK